MTQMATHAKVNRLDRLIKSNQKLFHTQDLALLWEVTNRNTLYTTIKRLVKKGILIPVVKGLYSTLPLEEIDDFALGAALIHKFSYISLETILEKEGVISQKIYPITFISSVSQKIEFNQKLYSVRKLKNEFLLNPEGVTQRDNYFIASKERAIADMNYFNPKYYLDNPSIVDWAGVEAIQKKVGYKK